jgi:hypothetical protein
MKRRLTRRMFLHSAAGGALALPLLNDFTREAKAQTEAFKRLVVIFTPNGVIQKGWKPASTAPFTPGETHQPFVTDGHANDLVVIPNLDAATALYDSPGGDAHGLGIGCLLTGTQLMAGDQFKAGMGGPGSGWPGGQSVDQTIADRIGTATKFRSLEFALKRAAGTLWTRLSYRDAAEPIAPLDDPGVAWDTVFGDVDADPEVVARSGERRKSVLAGTMEEFTALSAQLSGTDKKKVEAHLDAISDIESRIDILGSMPGTCTPPEKPTLGQTAEVFRNDSGMEVDDPGAHADVPLRQETWRKIMVASLACDLTRVTSFIMAPSRSDIYMTWLNNPSGQPMSKSHHNYSHDDPGDAENAPNDSGQALITIDQWYAQMISNIVTDMKGITEGEGTAFDNTVLLWVNELGLGWQHTHNNVPFCTLGNAGGAIQTGQALNITAGTSHNDLLLSICHAMGLTDLSSFGNPTYCSGTLPGFLV